MNCNGGVEEVEGVEDAAAEEGEAERNAEFTPLSTSTYSIASTTSTYSTLVDEAPEAARGLATPKEPCAQSLQASSLPVHSPLLGPMSQRPHCYPQLVSRAPLARTPRRHEPAGNRRR